MDRGRRRWVGLFVVLAMVGFLAAAAPAEAAPPFTRTQFSSANYSVSEGAGTATITVTRNGNVSGTTNVSVTLTDDTATSPADYTNSSPIAVNFAAKEKKKTFAIPIANDTDDEANETVDLSLAFVSGAGSLGTPNTAELTIVDNDLSGSGISINDPSGSEAVGSLVFNVTLSPAATQPVSVHYQTANGTATAGQDYTTSSGTVNFAAGVTLQTVSVPITDDNVDEPSHHFNVDLSSPVNAVISDVQGVGTITDNDSSPTVSLGNGSALENAGTLTLTATLTGATEQEVTVDHSGTFDGDADGGSPPCGDPGVDYIHVPAGTLTFPAGVTTQDIVVTICDDAEGETDQDFGVLLTSATNATIDDASGVGTILDDDGATFASFTNSNGLTIPAGAPVTTTGNANPYPSEILVSGLTGTITEVEVTLTDVTHTFPDDIDVLLVSPDGDTVYLMSDVGASFDISGVDLTFDDDATSLLPDATAISSGTYDPTNHLGNDGVDDLGSPAPVGPYGAAMGDLDGGVPNGTWKLFVRDDQATDTGSIGSWTLTITTSG